LEDGVAAVVNLLTALHAQGVGTCWVAGDKKEYAGDILRVIKAPATLKLIALIACGYPEDSSPRPGKRRLSEMVHWEIY